MKKRMLLPLVVLAFVLGIAGNAFAGNQSADVSKAAAKAAKTQTASMAQAGQCGGQIHNVDQYVNNLAVFGAVPAAARVAQSAGYSPRDGAFTQWLRDRVIVTKLARPATIINYGCNANGLFKVKEMKTLTAGWPVLVALPANYDKSKISTTPKPGYRAITIRVRLVGQASCTNPGEAWVWVVIYVPAPKAPGAKGKPGKCVVGNITVTNSPGAIVNACNSNGSANNNKTNCNANQRGTGNQNCVTGQKCPCPTKPAKPKVPLETVVFNKLWQDKDGNYTTNSRTNENVPLSAILRDASGKQVGKTVTFTISPGSPKFIRGPYKNNWTLLTCEDPKYLEARRAVPIRSDGMPDSRAICVLIKFQGSNKTYQVVFTNRDVPGATPPCTVNCGGTTPVCTVNCNPQPCPAGQVQNPYTSERDCIKPETPENVQQNQHPASQPATGNPSGVNTGPTGPAAEPPSNQAPATPVTTPTQNGTPSGGGAGSAPGGTTTGGGQTQTNTGNQGATQGTGSGSGQGQINDPFA